MNERYLSSDGGFDKAGEDSAVADLRRDDLINSQEGALAKVRFLGIRISVDSGRAGRFAVKVGSVMVAAAIDDLCSKPGEQCLGAVCAINHVELAFGLRADDALFERFVVWEAIKMRKPVRF